MFLGIRRSSVARCFKTYKHKVPLIWEHIKPELPQLTREPITGFRIGAPMRLNMFPVADRDRCSGYSGCGLR